MRLYTQYFFRLQTESQLDARGERSASQPPTEADSIARLQSANALETLRQVKENYYLERQTFL